MQGYNKLAPPPANAGFSGPSGLGGATQAPSGYIGMRFYPGVYDPSQCAAACVATTAYDKYHLVSASGTYDACNYFNSYVLSKNNEPLGTCEHRLLMTETGVCVLTMILRLLHVHAAVGQIVRHKLRSIQWARSLYRQSELWLHA